MRVWGEKEKEKESPRLFFFGRGHVYNDRVSYHKYKQAENR